MCGRTTIITKKEVIEKRFGVEIDFDWKPNYNAAPSQILPIITNENPNKVTLAYWGLVPHWAKFTDPVKPMINARADGIEKKPFFKHAFKKNRCLVIVDGFYEWERKGTTKIPYRICLHSGDPFAMAGIWEPVTDEKGKTVPSFAIITTEANSIVGKIHNRMPVILQPDREKVWLDASQVTESTLALLKPYSDEEINLYPVSSRVNKATVNEANLTDPIE